jgi:hypothetical protein
MIKSKLQQKVIAYTEKCKLCPLAESLKQKNAIFSSISVYKLTFSAASLS